LSGEAARILAQLARCRPVDQWDAGAVFRLAGVLGVSLRPRSGHLLVHGPREVVTALAPAFRRHKAALMVGPCRICRAELATESRHLCAWCAVVASRRVTYAPDCASERAFLQALPEVTAHQPNDDDDQPRSEVARR
jgi:hypothetical protein